MPSAAAVAWVVAGATMRLENVAVVEAALADVALVAPIAVQRCLRRCPSLGRVVLVGVVVE